MTWKITSYFKALYDEEQPPPHGLVLDSISPEQLGVLVEFTAEDDWQVMLCHPWNHRCLAGLSKEDAFETGDQVVYEWTKSINQLMYLGKIKGGLVHTPAIAMEQAVANKGWMVCNRVRDRFLLPHNTTIDGGTL